MTIERIDFNERAKIVHKNNEKWWLDLDTLERIERNKGEMLMLVITELAEAAEGIRKNLMDDHLPHRKMAEVELADAEIRMLDFAGGFGYEIDSGIINSIYDKTRDEILKNVEEFLPLNELEQLMDVAHPVFVLNQIANGENFVDLTPDDIPEVVTAIIFCIRLFGHLFNYDVEGAYHEKLEYNKTRKDHSIEERRKEGGKKV